ncbi:hypothetical protein BT96DRAFT_947996 [Gymnopus androsaceus JB14]|uniref:Uncharacterized protein n=1 Tax=Gymnopus androsaceus JB14 TaxID=1447944 RepID=A0A6A4GRY7_9AGAR|nr:hypothetical protein BT96DRAFT_947996 [Gymnopus androsaceus JB14]
MADSQQLPAPLTNSLRSDILLLSSYLNRKQSSPSEHHPKNTNLPLFVDISTLLAIGNSDSLGSANVNAVVGQTTTSTHGPALELLVCVENARQDETLAGKGKGTTERGKNAGKRGQKGGNSGRKSGPTESVQITGEEHVGSLLDIELNKENGRKLLNDWRTERGRNKAVAWQNDFTFNEHLQDLFDVIVALDNMVPSNISCFQDFIHHCAFRKLGCQVLEFCTHWGELPFKILSKFLHGLEPKTIPVSAQKQFQTLIKVSYKLEPEPEMLSTSKTTSTSEHESVRMYCVNSDNASTWLLALEMYWSALQREALDNEGKKPRARTTSPGATWIPIIMPAIMLLDALMPVLEHLLSAPGAAHALAKAELEQYFSCTQKPGGDMSLKLVQENTAVSENDDQDSGLVYDITTLTSLEQSVQCVLQSMRTILAWYNSCKHIFKTAVHFQCKDVKLRLSRFNYHDDALKPAEFDVCQVLPLFQDFSASELYEENAMAVICNTLEAKIHAEAALMHWIAAVKDKESTKDWPIGVSKKSCQLCWLLCQAYNTRRHFKFILPANSCQHQLSSRRVNASGIGAKSKLPIVICWTHESKRQDNSSPSPMADPQQSLAPLTDSLRSDVLLLSSYLDGKQSFPSEAHSKDATLLLYLRLLTLLAVSNKSNLRAGNENAVIGETTPNAVQFLVCAENAKQHKDKARAVRQHIRGNPPQSGKDKAWTVLQRV